MLLFHTAYHVSTVMANVCAVSVVAFFGLSNFPSLKVFFINCWCFYFICFPDCHSLLFLQAMRAIVNLFVETIGIPKCKKEMLTNFRRYAHNRHEGE